MILKTAENIALIWKHTGADFKGTLGDKKSVMWNENGGTRLGPIEMMPDDIFEAHLEDAKRRELCLQRDKLLRPIYERFGHKSLMTSTNQFREDFKTVIEVFKELGGNELAEKIATAIRDAYVRFPENGDSDGILLPATAVEVDNPQRGCLEISIIRPNSKVTRYFAGNDVAIADLYKQAISNPFVQSYSIL